MCTLLSPFGGAQMPENSIRKNYFWVVLYYFSYMNGSNDLVRGLFSSLDIGTYIPPACGPLSTSWGLFRGAQMPQNRKKNYFMVVLDYFSYTYGPNDLFRGLFSNLDIGTYILLTCGPLCTFFGPFEGARMPQSSIKINFSDCSGLCLSRISLMIWLGSHFEAYTLHHTSGPPGGI
jgi:hypothetical protein